MPSEEITALAAVFSGDPAGRNCNDNPQACNRYGTTFSFAGGSLWMGELQYAINQDKKSLGLPGVYKVGAWYATADFADQRYGLDAGGAIVSLASPAVTDPLNHRGNWGIYGVADQMVWRNGPSSLNLFVRSGVSPSERNLLSYYVDTGAGFKGLIPGRADDVLTFGAAYARISRDAVGARPRQARDQRSAISDPRLRIFVRGELSGADRAVVDRAAGPAIHRPSRRPRAGPEQS